MKTKVLISDHNPEPKVGMIIENEKGDRFIIKPCTCYSPEKAWPNKNNGCGAHLYFLNSDGNYQDTGYFCYCSERGWLDNYYIITEDPVIKDTILKKKTVPKNTTCPLCGGYGEDLVFAFYCYRFGCRNFKS